MREPRWTTAFELTIRSPALPTCSGRSRCPDDVRVRGSHSVAIDESGRIRITFYPAAVDLGGEHFDALKKVMPFKAEKPPNAPATSKAPKTMVLQP